MEDMFIEDSRSESEAQNDPTDVDIASIARAAYFKIASEMLGNAGRHVSEICSPPRVFSFAHKLGLTAGFALDLLESDPFDGKPWDFRIKRNAIGLTPKSSTKSHLY